jgi:hypothetical protein
MSENCLASSSWDLSVEGDQTDVPVLPNMMPPGLQPALPTVIYTIMAKAPVSFIEFGSRI